MNLCTVHRISHLTVAKNFSNRRVRGGSDSGLRVSQAASRSQTAESHRTCPSFARCFRIATQSLRITQQQVVLCATRLPFGEAFSPANSFSPILTRNVNANQPRESARITRE
jgi:hypothetical protein